MYPLIWSCRRIAKIVTKQKMAARTKRSSFLRISDARWEKILAEVLKIESSFSTSILTSRQMMDRVEIQPYSTKRSEQQQQRNRPARYRNGRAANVGIHMHSTKMRLRFTYLTNVHLTSRVSPRATTRRRQRQLSRPALTSSRLGRGLPSLSGA